MTCLILQILQAVPINQFLPLQRIYAIKPCQSFFPHDEVQPQFWWRMVGGNFQQNWKYYGDAHGRSVFNCGGGYFACKMETMPLQHNTWMSCVNGPAILQIIIKLPACNWPLLPMNDVFDEFARELCGEFNRWALLKGEKRLKRGYKLIMKQRL